MPFMSCASTAEVIKYDPDHEQCVEHMDRDHRRDPQIYRHLEIILIKTDPWEYRHLANPINGIDNIIDRTGNQKE